MSWILRPSRPPLALTICCQTWYPRRAADPGSEKSPVRGSEMPTLIGAFAAVSADTDAAANTATAITAAATSAKPALGIFPPVGTGADRAVFGCVLRRHA